MGKVAPITTFRRAAAPDPSVVDAFVALDDAPGATPLVDIAAPVLEVVPPPVEPPAALVVPAPVVQASTATAPATAADASTPGARWRRKTLRRADGRELRKQTFYLDAELSHRLVVACASAQYELSEAIEEAVHVWLQSR